MKLSLLSLIAGLLTLGSANARNPQPLRMKPQESPPQGESIRRVVLVHGFLENGTAFSHLKKRLHRQGFVCLVPKLRPSDGRGGLEALAQGLKRDIDAAFGTDQPIQIVGFSMGGVVSRYYLQNLGGAERCEKLFTIASPHNGTKAAWLYPTKGAEQMRPGSGFLEALAKTETNLGTMPVVSYRTPLDLVILPASSSIWERAVNISHPALLHPLMLSSSAVIADLEKRLAE
jgi:triacylglycerol lipase